MATVPEERFVESLIAAAEATMAKAKVCWAVTIGEDGQASARPMAPLARAPGDEVLTSWFLTSRNSRKAREMAQAASLTLVFQHKDDSYVSLVGRPELITDRALIRSRWREDWNQLYAGGSANENAVFVRADPQRLELWVRGVTPEPFGLRSTVLERDRTRQWRHDRVIP